MKPGESIRFRCDECLVVFDLCLAPVTEWPEEPESEDDKNMDVHVANCPFCGSPAAADLVMLHDRATQN